MEIINFANHKMLKKQQEIEFACNNAIEIFGIAKFNYGVRFNITTAELTKLLGIIYDSYDEKRILKHYREDIKCYLNYTVNNAITTKDKITSAFIIDSLLCPLYERRIEEGKRNNECNIFEHKLKKIIMKGNNLYGGKYN